MNRTAIIDRIIEEQNILIESLQQSVDRYKTASDIDEESTHDPEDFSNQTVAKDMQLRFEKMLGEAQFNLDFLQKEKEETHDEVENGCLIETDKNYLFVGVSVPAFKIGDKEVISFSEDAPVFAELNDKKIGDKVKIGEGSYKIVRFI